MAELTTSDPTPTREPWGSWTGLFQHCVDPIFLLSRRRQLRFVNRSWEKLTGKSSETMRGLFCLPRKKKGTLPQRVLLQTMAPPPEVLAGRTLQVRRPAPPSRSGPPWWDVTFVPLRDAEGVTGIIGFIRVVEGPPKEPGAGGFSEALIALRQRTAARFSFDLLESASSAVQRIEAQARLAAQLRTPVWIVGEPGTGKETLARVIHFQGLTREQTFLALDCLGLQPFLLRNMLFGHIGQAGNRLGTVYLKDPGSLPSDLQAELLDWLEEQDDPPRLIVGSRDLTGDDPKAGRLLPEFHAVLNVLEIRLPPVRDRTPDLPRLVDWLLDREANRVGAVPELGTGVFDVLSRHSWPGNFRELAGVLRDALAESNGGRIELNHLPLYLRAGKSLPQRPPIKLDEILERIEARMISLAVKKAKGNRSEAADALGIPRARLLRRMEVLKIGAGI